jgi:hypothetical protein
MSCPPLLVQIFLKGRPSAVLRLHNISVVDPAKLADISR